MFIDSHCHLDRVNLDDFQGSFDIFVDDALKQGIDKMLCVCIDLENYPAMLSLIEPYADIYVSVGVHPNESEGVDPTVEQLIELAKHPKNIAIGETGLDYFRSEGDLDWQQDRFRNHIEAAKECGKPLIIHTREAREDTISIMREQQAEQAGGVMHCFTENWPMAKAALDMGFYISFSGIVTFNSAKDLQAVAKKIPLDRMLIETDSPYLAPVPHRGKSNRPQYVPQVAECLAQLRGLTVQQIAKHSSDNFYRLFQAD